jgi:hypothetical protein
MSFPRWGFSVAVWECGAVEPSNQSIAEVGIAADMAGCSGGVVADVSAGFAGLAVDVEDLGVVLIAGAD